MKRHMQILLILKQAYPMIVEPDGHTLTPHSPEFFTHGANKLAAYEDGLLCTAKVNNNGDVVYQNIDEYGRVVTNFVAPYEEQRFALIERPTF